MATDEHNDLSDYTIHLRRALQYCEREQDVLVELKQTLRGLKTIERAVEVRNASLEWFRREHLPSKTIPLVHVDDICASEFRRKFHRGNLPCRIRGLDGHQFAALSTQWRAGDGAINRDWFCNVVGDDTTVPVRQQTTGAIDQDGRAEECKTLEYSMRQWADCEPGPHLYLKDWHLVKHLQERGICETLYEVPEFFQRDLLNGFLTRVTGGDYKFVYWGPAGSRTAIHSDVLNSFSWSYNVVGEKKWTFYPPDEDISIEVYQQAGECMFVPSGWKHEVANVVETLSINHNWATSANIDQLVDCVIAEMKAVEGECREWGITGFEAREAMLRGCAGLDLSGCFFLLLSSLLDLDCTTDTVDLEVDAALLKGALELLMRDAEHSELQNRLSAVLASEDLAQQALGIAKDLLS